MATDKVRLRLSSVIFSNWHVVINNYILPHIFLEDLYQVHPKITDLAALENFKEHRSRVFDAVESISDETAAMFALAVDIAVSVMGHNKGILLVYF